MRRLLLFLFFTSLFCKVYSQACDAPQANGTTICPGSSAILKALGETGEYRWYDALSEGNLLFTGAEFTTPTLSTTTNYYVEVVYEDCISPRTSVTVTVGLKPSVSAANICAGSAATLNASGIDGIYEWYDAALNGNLLYTGRLFKTPELSSTTVYYVQATVNGCTSSRTAATVTVNERHDPPAVPNVAICAGSSTILTAAGAPGSVFQWFDVPEGGAPLIISPDFTTPSLNATTTFYVQSLLNGCTSIRTAVTVTVNPIPPEPTVKDQTICAGSTATLEVSGGDTYVWYAVPSRGNPIGTGEVYTTPVLNRTTTYFVETTANGCSSTRTPVTVTVTQMPEAPTVTGQAGCLRSAVTLTASSPGGGSYTWFDAPEGGTLLSENSIFTTPVLESNTTYYVQASIGSCTSPRTAVNVTLSDPPPAPVIADIVVCSGGTVTLTPDSVSGNLEWFDAPVGGNLLLIAPQFTSPSLNASTTYYVQTSLNGCTSERVAVRVTVKPVPPVPIVSGITVCEGSKGVLAVSPSLSSTTIGNLAYEWFDSAGNLLATASSFTTPPLTGNSTYYVQAVLEGCASPRVPVTVTIVTSPGRLFRYSSGTYCKDSRDPMPIRFTNLTGTFTALPAGLVFKDASTGEIDLNASAVGEYLITFTANTSCPISSTIELKITSNPNPVFKFEGPYCQGDTNPFASYPTGGSGGVFSFSSPGLVFAGDGAIDLQRSRPGSYIITNTIPSNGGSCAASSATDTVVILPAVLVNAGIDQVITPGSKVSLAGIVQNSSGYSWSGGKGTFADSLSLNPIYHPSPDEASIMLFLTARAVAPCLTPKTDTVLISVLFTPMVANQIICYGTTATLSVDAAPSVVYEWYEFPTGGNPLLVNPSFTTPALASDKTYYVRALLDGLSSPRVPLKVTVLPAIEAPKVADAAICAGSSVKFMAGSASGSENFRWYDAASGGNLVGTEHEFTTPELKFTTSYYVEKISGNCHSGRTEVTVTVAPKPSVTSAALFTICDSSALNYQITADHSSVTFLWSRASVPGISNTAVSDQTTPFIRETLNSTLTVPVQVTYVITPTLNGCIGDPFDFVVTVDPSPVVTSPLQGEICNNSASNYTIAYNMEGTNFSWSRAAVSGISNRSIGGQRSGTIREILTNTTNAPIEVSYIFNQSFDGCPGPAFIYKVTVNPSPQITSASSSVLCNNTVLNYKIASNVKGAAFLWSRAAINGISNAPVSDEASASINETLINTTRNPIVVTYRITATANGCIAPAFNYRVTVNPTAAPLIKATTTLCVGGRIALSTTQVQEATYSWRGPNGFTSDKLNPLINNATEANDGLYSLVVTINGCVSDTAYADIEIVDSPLANAGVNQTVCANTSGIQLRGTISGGASAGAWTSSGSGTFSPSNTDINAVYLPSQKDKIGGLVKLSLTATSNCGSAVSSIDITLVPVPIVNAGADLEVCSQSPNVTLKGKISIPQSALWSSSGSGVFKPSNTSLNAVYIPSRSDINKGGVVLTLTSASLSICPPVNDDITIKIVPPPLVNTGQDILLPLGKTVTLNPNVNYKDVNYLWTPNINLSDNTVKNPVLTGVTDQVYKLTVTDSRGCVTEDEIFVDVLMPIVTYNTFSPNGDGANDVWNIPELTTYPDNIVTVFNRYGDKIFSSVGYNQPWDGTHNGSPAPVGTYYYIIDTKFPGLKYSGYVTILR